MEQTTSDKLQSAEKFLTRAQILSVINTDDDSLIDGFLALNERIRLCFKITLWKPAALAAFFSGIEPASLCSGEKLERLDDYPTAVGESDARVRSYKALLEDYTESELPEEGMDPIEYLEHFGDGPIRSFFVEKKWYQLAMDLCIEGKMNESK